MPSNGRWDLIRRLKVKLRVVNVFTAAHSHRHSSHIFFYDPFCSTHCSFHFYTIKPQRSKVCASLFSCFWALLFSEESFVKRNFYIIQYECVFLEDWVDLYIHISATTPPILRFLVVFPSPSRKMQGFLAEAPAIHSKSSTVLHPSL